MKNKAYILNIQNPCHEKWEEMQPQNGGKFCMQCSKKVFDFTDLDNSEIIKVIEQSKGSICGRMSISQLNRPIEIQPQTKNNFSRFYKTLAGIFLIGTTGNAFTTTTPLTEKEVLSRTNDTHFQPRKISFAKQVVTDSLKNVIKGQVLTEFEDLIPGADIIIKELNLETETDLEGNFSITLPEDLSDNYVTIIINHLGFQDFEFRLHKNDFALVKKFYLKEEIWGDIIVIRKVRWWQFWKKFK